MKLKVNRTTIELFEGAEIRDVWGHEIDLDAPASAFTQIRLKFKD